MWAFGVDVALPLGMAAAILLSPFAVNIAMKEEDQPTPEQWWRHVPSRGRGFLAAQPGLKGRLTALAELPMVVLALVWFGVGTLLLIGWRRLRGA